jgi:hypothetical protein
LYTGGFGISVENAARRWTPEDVSPGALKIDCRILSSGVASKTSEATRDGLGPVILVFWLLVNTSTSIISAAVDCIFKFCFHPTSRFRIVSKPNPSCTASRLASRSSFRSWSLLFVGEPFLGVLMPGNASEKKVSSVGWSALNLRLLARSLDGLGLGEGLTILTVRAASIEVQVQVYSVSVGCVWLPMEPRNAGSASGRCSGSRLTNSAVPYYVEYLENRARTSTGKS